MSDIQHTLPLSRRLGAVLCGGFLGAIARYLLSQLIQNMLGKGWPYDILLINLTGALVLAFVTTLADETVLVGPTRRLFINVGFLGAYTTFSSLALGDVLLATAGHWLPALAYLLISLVGGLLAVLLGDMLALQVIVRLKASALPKFAQGHVSTHLPQLLEDKLEAVDVQDDLYDLS